MKRGRPGMMARVGICFLLLAFVILPMTSQLSVAAEKKLLPKAGETTGSAPTEVAQAAAGAAGAGEAAAGAAAAGAAAGVSAATLAVIGGIAAAVVVGSVAADEDAAAVHH
ncbi:MAG: hypothetical protein JRJ03_13915 [Deltaproteobacteria bacterium]|nr:hypothetical protein [Deltaproteobacteria bacterium]